MAQYLFTLETDNTLRVLQRIASVFSRNRVNIKQLNVQESPCETHAHFSIMIKATPITAKRVEQQLTKIIEIKKTTQQTFSLTPNDDISSDAKKMAS